MFSEEPSSDPIAMSEAEYLAFELNSPFKYEYRNGKAFYKGGENHNHSLIKGNLLLALKSVETNDCLVYLSGLRLKAEALNDYLYPDLMIVCGETKLAEAIFDTVLNPTVLIEILSPKTESLDRGDKFHAYQKIPTLKDYLIVSQDTPKIDQFTHLENKRWLYTPHSNPDSEVKLSSIETAFVLADAYKKVDFP